MGEKKKQAFRKLSENDMALSGMPGREMSVTRALSGSLGASAVVISVITVHLCVHEEAWPVTAVSCSCLDKGRPSFGQGFLCLGCCRQCDQAVVLKLQRTSESLGETLISSDSGAPS